MIARTILIICLLGLCFSAIPNGNYLVDTVYGLKPIQTVNILIEGSTLYFNYCNDYQLNFTQTDPNLLNFTVAYALTTNKCEWSQAQSPTESDLLLSFFVMRQWNTDQNSRLITIDQKKNSVLVMVLDTTQSPDANTTSTTTTPPAQQSNDISQAANQQVSATSNQDSK